MKPTRVKIMTIFLLVAYLSISSCEEEQKNVDIKSSSSTNTTTDSSKPPDKMTSTVIHDRSDEPQSIMSRIASWWPFGSSDSSNSNIIPSDKMVDNAVAEDHHLSVQYLPALSGHGGGGKPQRAFCHPCNHEPWIPVAANYGHNTIIGFVQPSNYGGKPPSPQYGPPSQQYGPPPNQQYGPPPNQQYGPPPNQQYAPPPNQQYGPPPNQQYSPPIGINDEYGPPHSVPSHGQQQQPPPQLHLDSNVGFDLPGPSSNLGQIYGSPKPIYGPPKLQLKPHFIQKLPKVQYGPPKLNYGPPPKPQYGPPKPNYGSPKPIHGPPQGKHNQGAPNLSAYLAPPSANFGAINFKSKLNQPLKIGYGTPLDQFGPQKYGPPKPFMAPPQQNYRHPNQQNGIPLSLHVQPSIEILSGQLNLGNIAHAQPFVIDPEYLPPKEHQELPLSNGPDDFINQPLPPIPLPNLSSAPMAPIYEPQPFTQHIDNSHFASQQQDTNFDNSQSVEVQQSVPLADYIASIEHPINVIQSPITDLNVAFHPGGNFEPQIHDDGFDYAGSFSGQDSNGQYSYNSNLRLSEHPIVVADINSPAASTTNETVVNPHQQESKKRDNDQDLSISFFHQELPKVTPQFINQIVYHEKPTEYVKQVIKDINHNFIGVTNHGVPSKFLSQTPEYSNWNPTLKYDTISTSSMVPPPKDATSWLSTVATAKPLEVTKKPKEIQIIIPYTTNNNKNKGNIFGSSSSSHDKLLQVPKIESVWVEHSKDSIKLSPNAEKISYTQNPPTTSSIINIKELLNENSKHINGHSYSNLPFDIVRLQKNIDGWTEQEYANTMKLAQKHAVTSRYVTAKKIPDHFFTTVPYEDNEVTTTKYSQNTKLLFFDHEPSGSNNKESKFINNELANNFVITESTPTTTSDDYFDTTTDYVPTTFSSFKTETWQKLQVSVSPITKEKIYVVTPQSIVAKRLPNLRENEISGNVSYASHKFAVKINSEEMTNNSSEEYLDDIKVVLSEWPHIINNLETTTTSPKITANQTLSSLSTTPVVSSTSRRHPLFGLIDLSAFTAGPPNGGATIQTYSGHSKVASSSSSGTTKINFPTSTTLAKSISTSTTKPTLKS